MTGELTMNNYQNNNFNGPKRVCKNCWRELPPNATFCGNCGTEAVPDQFTQYGGPGNSSGNSNTGKILVTVICVVLAIVIFIVLAVVVVINLPCRHKNWVPATCTSAKYCSDCGHEEGIPLGHNYNKATCTKPMTCKACGATHGEPEEHDFSGASCIQPAQCRICGYSDGKTVAHDYKSATCTKAKVCKECGKVSGKPLGHSYQKATCTKPKTCKVCKATSGKALGHSFAAATCTKPQTCKNCKVTTGKALGHKFKADNCFDNSVCEKCGKEGNPLGHEWYNPTCTEPARCKHCNAEGKAATGHSYVGDYCKYCKEVRVIDFITDFCVYDQDGLEITYYGYEYNKDSSGYFTMNFEIDNDCGYTEVVQIREFSVNGYMVSASMSEEIADGKSAKTTVRFSKSALKKAGLSSFEQVKEIQFKFIRCNSGYELSDVVSLGTN